MSFEDIHRVDSVRRVGRGKGNGMKAAVATRSQTLLAPLQSPTGESDNESERGSPTGMNSLSASTSTSISSPVQSRSLSPNRVVTSTSKSWMSPFSNWMSRTPESQSKYSMADLSPHSIFSSPWIHQSDLPSPPPTKGKDYGGGSIFSPSFFSPFNKSMNPLKLEKFNGDSDDHDSLLLMSESLDSELKLNGIQSRREEFEMATNNVVSVLDMDKEVFSEPRRSRSQGRRGNFGERNYSQSVLENLPGSSPSNPPPIRLKCQEARAPKHSIIFPKEIAPKVEKISVSTPSSSNLPFSSPPSIAKAKQSTMSPDMGQRGHCNCKKSRCLKLYCECFAALRYCSSCNCVDCNNSVEFNAVPFHSTFTSKFNFSSQVRQEAIQLTRDRNPSAFQMKVSVNKGHMAGCHCKKSRCLKKYCECFEGAVYCGPNCKCLDCHNVSGSDALKSVKSNQKRERTNLKIECSDSEGDVGLRSQQINPSLSPCATSDNGISATPFKVRSKRFILQDRNDPSTEALNLSASDINSTPLMKSTQRRKIKSDQSGTPSSCATTSPDENSTRPSKRCRVDEPIYSFFGSNLPPTTKVIALSCLEYLDGPSLYSMSCVSHLWNQAVMDDALWE